MRDLEQHLKSVTDKTRRRGMDAAGTKSVGLPLSEQGQSLSLDRLLANKITRPPAGLLMRKLLTSASFRRALNRRYQRFSPRTKGKFASLFSRAFWKAGPTGWSDRWTLEFGGRVLVVPLRPETINLDWIYATSILSHDLEVITTYERFLKSSEERPALFLDIGANYGMHSLLFAIMGIPVIAFEPNPTCSSYAKGVFEANNVQPDLRGIAVGDRGGTVDLVVPEGESWLGTIMPEVGNWLKGKRSVSSFRVDMQALDDLDIQGSPVLIKIDIEGAEEAVLRGARALIERLRPSIIFESYGEAKREQIAIFLAEVGYSLYSLPFDPTAPSPVLRPGDFVRSPQSNFIARPA